MSKGFTKLPNNVLLNNDLDAMSKIVFGALSYYDRGRGCWASRDTLSKMIGCSLYQLRKALVELEDKGFILINRRHRCLTDKISVVKPVDDRDEDVSSTDNSVGKKKKTKEIELGIDIPTAAIDTEKTTEVSNEPESPTIPPTEPAVEDNYEDLSQHLSDTELLLRGITEKIRDKKRMDLYFSGIRVVGKDDCKLVISHSNEVVRDLLRSNHYHQMLEDVSGKNIEIVR